MVIAISYYYLFIDMDKQYQVSLLLYQAKALINFKIIVIFNLRHPSS